MTIRSRLWEYTLQLIKDLDQALYKRNSPLAIMKKKNLNHGYPPTKSIHYLWYTYIKPNLHLFQGEYLP